MQEAQEFLPKTGFLLTKGDPGFFTKPKWVRRKFTLGPPDFVLRYYNDDDSVGGSFELRGATVRMIPSTVENEAFVFEICYFDLSTNKFKSLLLQADSQEDVDGWIAHLWFCVNVEIENPLPLPAEIADSKDCQVCKKKPEPGRIFPWYWYSCKCCGNRTCGDATCIMTKTSVTIPQTCPVVPGFGSGICMSTDCQVKYKSISECGLCKDSPDKRTFYTPWTWYACLLCGNYPYCSRCAISPHASVNVTTDKKFAGAKISGYSYKRICKACETTYKQLSECSICNKSPEGNVVVGMAWTWYHCAICSSNLCSECTESDIYDNRILLCKSKIRTCVEVNFKSYRNKTWQPVLRQFLISATSAIMTNDEIVERMNQIFWPKPTVTEGSNLQKKAETVLMLIDKVYPIGKEIKYVIGAISFITSRQFQQFWEIILGDRIRVLKPFLDLMNQRGSTGIIPHPCDIGDLYYYTCYLEQQRKLSNVETPPDFLSGKNLKRHPEEIMDLLGKYAGSANWMYIADLKSPHSTDSWNSWYLSQLIERDGFTLLLFVGDDNTKCPNASRVPAFCLAANSDTKEVILNIRGTVTETDVWDIDLNYDLEDFEYFEIHGKVQLGFYIGAKGILDYFGVRETILSLVKLGFNIRITGHSMGAAVAVIIAADLSYHHVGEFSEENLLCFAYACPPCFSDDLGFRLAQDNFVFCMINCDDLVPRITKDALSDFKAGFDSFMALREDSKSLASKWFDQDWNSYKDYLVMLGGRGRMDEAPMNSSDSASTIPSAEVSYEAGEDPINRSEPVITLTSSDVSCSSSSEFLRQTTTLGGGGRTIEAPVNTSDPALVPERAQIRFLRISSVGSARDPSDREFTVFYIDVQCAQVDPPTWTVYRRYSEFKNLRDELSSEGCEVPPLPLKQLIGAFGVDFLKEREDELEAWLKELEDNLETWQEKLERPRVNGMNAFQSEHYTRFLCEKANLSPRLLSRKFHVRQNAMDESLVIPGQILYAYCEKGRSNTIVSTYDEIKPMLTIKRLTMDAVNDHLMYQHMSILRNLRYLRTKGVKYERVARSVGRLGSCSVCKSDPAWPFIFKSDGFRALGMQMCSLCESPVCVICAPAGDEVRAEGLNETEKLPDQRIPLPCIGKLDPQRVCTPCYLNAYNHI